MRLLVFEEPEDLSPLVADLYRWWDRTRGLDEFLRVHGRYAVSV